MPTVLRLMTERVPTHNMYRVDRTAAYFVIARLDRFRSDEKSKSACSLSCKFGQRNVCAGNRRCKCIGVDRYIPGIYRYIRGIYRWYTRVLLVCSFLAGRARGCSYIHHMERAARVYVCVWMDVGEIAIGGRSAKKIIRFARPAGLRRVHIVVTFLRHYNTLSYLNTECTK